MAGQAARFGRLADVSLPALVGGAPGVVAVHRGRALSLVAFTVSGGRIAASHALSGPARLPGLTAGFLCGA